MASFEEHVAQSKRNLIFLNSINESSNGSWDWQVTVSFYTAVHLINAHIAKKVNLHYKSHRRVDSIINPQNAMALAKLDQTTYLAYFKLHGLSRRSRYLCRENPTDQDLNAYLTYDKHFSKSIKNLDIILSWFTKEYKITFDKHKISCLELQKYQSENFELEHLAT